MIRKLTSVTLAALMSSAPLFAQQQPEQTMPKLVESVEVRVINVDVVVTDKKGNPVKGLTKDDFYVYENGTPKVISNFYEAQAESTTTGPAPATAAAPAAQAPAAPAARTQPRKFIFFIDNLSLAPFNRNTVFKSMKDFVKTAIRPGDQAMIATWNRSMKVRVPFTSDTEQLQQTLDIIAGESAMGLEAISERKRVQDSIKDAPSYDEAVQAARGYAQSVEHDTRQTISALNGLLSTLAGVEGKKVLVMTTEGLPMNPGKEMFYYIDEISRDNSKWQNVGSTLIESTNFDATSLIQSIAQTANANGITIYPLHAAGLGAYNNVSAENQAPTSFTLQQTALSNSTDSMRLIADMTGGVATVGTNNFKDAFTGITRDLESYYSLGYRSGTERVDRQRLVEVRTKNRGLVVRARKSFVEKSIQTEMSDRVVANLFYENTSNDLGVFLTTKTPVADEDGYFLVPVEVHIPMEKLTVLPQGETNYGGFTVYIVVANKDGDMSDVQTKENQFRIPPADLEKLKGKHYTYEVNLKMEKGRNRISIGVVDSISSVMGFQRQEVIAADLR